MDKLSNIVGKNIQGIFRKYKNMDKSYVYIGCGSLEQCKEGFGLKTKKPILGFQRVESIKGNNSNQKRFKILFLQNLSEMQTQPSDNTEKGTGLQKR